MLESKKSAQNTDIHEQLRDMREDNHDLELALRIRYIRNVAKTLQAGKIPETPSIKRLKENIIYLTKQSIPLLVTGDTGTGKTTVLQQIARDHLSEAAVQRYLDTTTHDPNSTEYKSYLAVAKEPYLISGHRALDPSDIVGGMALEVDGGATETKFEMGPVYKALEEGKPLIIDEWNAIPHSSLILLNHLVTRKPGDLVTVQGDSKKSFIVKEGFCILATGNFGDKYDHLREDVDVASLDRFIKLSHGYLTQYYPQDQGTYPLEGHESLDNELFTLLIGMHMHDGKTFSDVYDVDKQEYTILNMLWTFAMVIKSIQDEVEKSNTSIKPPSMRVVINIMSAFHANMAKNTTIEQAFESAIYDMYISQQEGDGALQFHLYSIFKGYNFFTEWAVDGNIETGLNKMTPPEQDSTPQITHIIPDVVLARALKGALPAYTDVDMKTSQEPLTIIERALLKESHGKLEAQKAELEKLLAAAITKREKGDTSLDTSMKTLEEAIAKIGEHFNK